MDPQLAAFCLAHEALPVACIFLRFHMKLVLENYTTIENLDREATACMEPMGATHSTDMPGGCEKQVRHWAPEAFCDWGSQSWWGMDECVARQLCGMRDWQELGAGLRAKLLPADASASIR